MPEYARVCQSMPEYARVCQSMPEYAPVDVPDIPLSIIFECYILPLTGLNTFVFTGLNAQKLQLDGWMYDLYFKVWIVDKKSLDPKKIGIPKNKILAAR